MPTWQDLERRLDVAIQSLTPQMVEALDDAANILVMQLMANTPVGEGPTPFLHRAMTTRGMVITTDRSAAVGVAPKELLGDPKDEPPRGTIREFLDWWNKSGEDDRQNHHGTGLEAGGVFHAWWSLSRRQKEVLEQQRAAGKFGGQPPKAPYWAAQEEGNAAALITPQYYVKRSWEAALPLIRARLGGIRVL
jgi:hypothetical protein